MIKIFVLAASLAVSFAASAFAQDAARPTNRPTTWSLGASCPAGQVATVMATGMIACTNTIDNAANANTANTATTATTATNLDPNAVVGTNQLSGTFSSSQLQGALPTCSTGQVLTNVGGTMTCVTPEGGGSSAICPGGTASASSSYGGGIASWGGLVTIASQNVGASFSRTLSGTGYFNGTAVGSGSCTTTVTCGSNLTLAFTTCNGSTTDLNGFGGGISSPISFSQN